MAKRVPYAEALQVFASGVKLLDAALKKWIPQLGELDRAAIAGNGGAESYGFTAMQEWNPTVKGSKGGLGWFQWTGVTPKNPRRKNFTDWCAKNGFTPDQPEANVGFLIHELTQTFEKKAIPALLAADTLDKKVVAFERSYERAGIKHYDARKNWARVALAVMRGEDVSQFAKSPPKTTTTKKAPTKKAPRQWAEDKLSRFEIEAIQKRLRELGYATVGKIDGKWGPNTMGAIIALQATAGITQDGHYGPETQAALASDANRRVVPQERAQTTVEDIRKQGSTTIKEADRITVGSGVAGAFSFLVAALGAIWEGFGDAVAGLGPFREFFASVPMWAWGLVGMAMSVFIGWKAGRIKINRRDSERLGIHNGEPDPAPSPPVEYGPGVSGGVKVGA